MTYHLSAWIVGGSIISLETDSNPITENHLPDLAHDTRVLAEVEGAYQYAADVMPLLSWDGSQLSGLDFVSQEVISP